MALVKTKEEIKILHEGGRILGSILASLASAVEPGISTMDLESLARSSIARAKAEPAFLGYKISPRMPAFPAALCTSVNHEIVHCFPDPRRILREGDIVSLDLGIKYKGLYTDAAVTVPVGRASAVAKKLIEVARAALQNGIGQVRAGNTIGDIANAIQRTAEGAGFGVIRELIGHGVGHAVHEKPDVPNFGKAGTLEKLKPGMVLAIEPMLTAGDYHIRFLDDGWRVVTADGSLSAHFEHTVAVVPEGYLVLTEI
ncbi:MAG: type I methionyl aminopeptidase [Candidatus Doudnabacteria bacterium]|nr:type I methionyl aminopeptidase [Candidatus Doudnabacteria bacterium]